MLLEQIEIMQRLVPDPSIGVSDLMAPLEAWFTKAKTRNIAQLVGRPAGLTWKTAPNPVWLAKLQPFMMDLVKISAHLVFASRKLKGALVKLNIKEKINYSKKDDDDFCDLMDDSIRLACKQLRDLKTDTLQKARAVSKCSQEEVAALEEILEAMAGKAESVVVPKIPTSWTAISDTSADPATSSTQILPEPIPLADIAPKCATDIFKRVLDRKVSEASSHPSPVRQGSETFKAFDSFAATGFFNPDEMAMLNQTMTQNKEEASKPPLKAMKKKNQKPAKAPASFQEKTIAKKKSNKKSSNSKLSKVSKKTAKAVDAPVKRKVAEPVKRKVSSKSCPDALFGIAKGEVSPTIEAADAAAAVAPKLEVDVKTMRKRSTSKAYHIAHKQALSEGKSQEEAKAAAQAAYKVEAKKWDEGEDIE